MSYSTWGCGKTVANPKEVTSRPFKNIGVHMFSPKAMFFLRREFESSKTGDYAFNMVDGRNPAPVDMVNVPSFTRFSTSQGGWEWDFFHQQYQGNPSYPPPKLPPQ